MAGPFHELLLPGENLLAVLEASGDPSAQGKTTEEVWYQVGVTAGRLLIVRMVRHRDRGESIDCAHGER